MTVILHDFNRKKTENSDLGIFMEVLGEEDGFRLLITVVGDPSEDSGKICVDIDEAKQLVIKLNECIGWMEEELPPAA